MCQRSGCSLSAAKYNNGYCVLHLQSWFPSELNKLGQPSVKRRGYGLYGPQFLLGYCTSNPRMCACSSPLCKKLGYSHHGMFHFSKDATDSVEAARILGMLARQRVAKHPCRFIIPPWHYHTYHQMRDAQGNWSLCGLDV